MPEVGKNKNELGGAKPVMVPRITKDNWPVDLLLKGMRVSAAKKVDKFVSEGKFVCDPMDLRQQVLFRLTTFHTNEIIDEKVLKESLMQEVIVEQYKIIKERLDKSTLPLNEVLRRSEPFSEKGWRIERRDKDTLLVANPEKSKRLPLEFREIDTVYAKAVFKDLHYIHTGRAEFALGMFVKGESLPFSIIGITRIDRYYKHLALMAQGYNTANCWNVVRLYNIPNSPMNTSSVMFANTVAYLKKRYPGSEAVLTSFTPSFATGKSMVAGGFNVPILSMPLKLTFGNPTGLGWERLTNRRTEDYGGETIFNKIPLLPIVHLMRPIVKPAQIASENSNKMLLLSDDTDISEFLRRQV